MFFVCCFFGRLKPIQLCTGSLVEPHTTPRKTNSCLWQVVGRCLRHVWEILGAMSGLCVRLLGLLFEETNLYENDSSTYNRNKNLFRRINKGFSRVSIVSGYAVIDVMLGWVLSSFSMKFGQWLVVQC